MLIATQTMNGLKTTLLLGGLTGLILAFGYYVGGQDGILMALIFAIIMNFGSYWFSDRLVLSMYHAKIVSETEAPQLHRIIDDLTHRAGMTKPRIAIIDLPVPNAFATGRNEKHAVVAVTTSIMRVLDERELRAVLAHELGHVKNRDILISSVAATLAGVISYMAQMIFFFGGGGRDRDGGNPLAALALVILSPIMAMIIQMAISRTREYEADKRGASFCGNPMDLAHALKKLDQVSHQMPLQGQPKHEATAHLFIVNPFASSIISRLFSTHPEVEDRIARLERM